jgi:hypothetical protein
MPRESKPGANGIADGKRSNPVQSKSGFPAALRGDAEV